MTGALQKGLEAAVIIATLVLLTVMTANFFIPFSPIPERTGAYEKHAFISYRFPFVTQYYLMKPEHIDPEQKYPLILILHGAKKKSYEGYVLADENMRQSHPAFVLMPIAPLKAVWSLPEGGPFKKVRFPALPLAIDILKHVRGAYAVDPDRIYVTGASIGGFGVFGAIINYPDLFAAAVPACGGWDYRDAQKVPLDLPIRAFHAADDPQIPVSYSRDTVQMIRTLGGNAELIDTTGYGHASWIPAFKGTETWNWLFSQKKANNPDHGKRTDSPRQ